MELNYGLPFQHCNKSSQQTMVLSRENGVASGKRGREQDDLVALDTIDRHKKDIKKKDKKEAGGDTDGQRQEVTKTLEIRREQE